MAVDHGMGQKQWSPLEVSHLDLLHVKEDLTMHRNMIVYYC